MADNANSRPATAGDDYMVVIVRPDDRRPLFLTETAGTYSPRMTDARRWRGQGDERAAHAAARAVALAHGVERGWRVLVVYDFGSQSEAARQVEASGAERFVEFDSQAVRPC